MKDLVLAKLESFYVGGTNHEMETTVFGREYARTGAMYVRRMVPAAREFSLPVVFVHGGMHTGVTWETTPDGRDGWETLFVRGGFETITIDQAWRGRSAPDLGGLNPTRTEPQPVPHAFTCGDQMARRFERGGGRFPIEHLDHYTSQLWPDFYVPTAFAAGQPGLSDPRALPPLVELIDKVGPVVLVTHSQGGHLGWMAACARPAKVAAVLAIEPALTCPGLDAPEFPEIPVKIMWGDNLPPHARTLSLADVEQARQVAALRPSVTVDLLPESGIHGNGHMLMMEDNSAELATRAMDWLRGLALA
ncbi:alpha/beta hydrolase family protein [Paraburkholderia phytofirmans]|uniref:hypothetical protein n=1 Tax=Paraburkholderia phytofirmans TaxID=261302 RepID=UPI0038B9E1D3